MSRAGAPTETTTPSEQQSQTSVPRRPILVGGEWLTTAQQWPVHRPASNREDAPIATTFLAGRLEYERAVEAAIAAERPLAALAAHERGDALRAVAAGILERREELSVQLAAEAGKPIKDARIEIERGALTFRIAGEEAERVYGEFLPLDVNAASRGRVAIVRRFPIGAVAAITPFNLPLGLAAHKVAPALAAGCPVILKPPSLTPLTMLSIAELVAETALPAGGLSVLPMNPGQGDALVTDPRLKMLSFTGSPKAGWSMKERAGRKKVVLELGSNSAAIIDATADVDRAAQRCAHGAFKYAGQLCISAQRLIVHRSVWDSFVQAFLDQARALSVGDPMDPLTDIGPLIDIAAVERVASWVDAAVQGGAKLLLGGEREGQYMRPTVLTDVPRHAALWGEEAFGPVAVLTPFEEIDEAIDLVNDSRFGLQTGIFTQRLAHVWRAFAELQVGGVIVNDGPTYRVDNMPFGGVKDSGMGREGIRWAIEDMTEPRTLVLGPH